MADVSSTHEVLHKHRNTATSHTGLARRQDESVKISQRCSERRLKVGVKELGGQDQNYTNRKMRETERGNRVSKTETTSLRKNATPL